MISAEEWAAMDLAPGGCVGPNAGHIVTRYRAVQADALRDACDKVQHLLDLNKAIHVDEWKYMRMEIEQADAIEKGGRL
jgi:hypothetical protein